MAKKLTAYLDESGATGRNFQDKSQPYFIVAGWLCDPVDDGVSRAVAGARGQMAELKGSSLLRKASGERRAAKLLRESLRAGAIPLVVVTEKRFALAAKLVEYFLEPTMNNIISNDFDVWDNSNVKKSLARLFYELPQDLTEHLWASLTSGRAMPSEVGPALQEVAQACSAGGYRYEGIALLGAIPHLGEICEQSNDNASGSSDALPAPSLMVLLDRLHEAAERLGIAKVDVEHDETVEFGPTLQTMMGYARDGYAYPPSFDVSEHLRTGSDRLGSLTLVDSKTEPRVQAADVLAATTAKAMASWMNRRTGESESAMLEVLDLSLEHDLFWFVGSDRMWVRLAEVLGPIAEQAIARQK